MSGGWTGSAYSDSTEIFDGNNWTTVGRLPWGIINFPIITIDNKVLSFGKHISKSIYRKMFNVFRRL